MEKKPECDAAGIRPAGRTLVKICGLRRPVDAKAANRAGQDFAGFILSPGFRRSISLDQAMELKRILLPHIRTVGVFVDAPVREVQAAAGSGCIDMIQLHGHESDADIAEVSRLTGLPVMQAFRISGRQDLERAASSSADWVLLDSGAGTGSPFDWDLLETFLRENGCIRNDFAGSPVRGGGRCTGTLPAGSSVYGACGAVGKSVDTAQRLFPGGHPWFLAGGLSIEGVGEAVRRFGPTGVDVSSKVETGGWKDPEKMKAFVEAVRKMKSIEPDG